MTKFLLLNPLTPEQFGMDSWEALHDSLEEFACKYLMSSDVEGNPVVFAVASSKTILENMCTIVDLDGTMVEYTATYDQLVRI